MNSNMVHFSPKRMSLIVVVVLHLLVVGCHSFSSCYSHLSLGKRDFTFVDHFPPKRNNNGFSTSTSKLPFVQKCSSSRRIAKKPLRLAIVDTLATDVPLFPSTLTSIVIAQEQSLESFWAPFWIISGVWNIVISSILFLQPNMLNTRDGGKDNPDIQTATTVGFLGIMYISFASDYVLLNLPLLGCIIPFGAILKLFVTPWLYENGCLSVASSTTSEKIKINAMDNEIDNVRRQQITQEEVNLWRFIAAGDAFFALVFIYYFTQYVIPAIQRLYT